MYDKKEKICPVYVSKQNSNHEKQVILLLVSNREIREARSEGRWHYLAIKKLWALLRGITLKNHGELHCLNCLHSFRKQTWIS